MIKHKIIGEGIGINPGKVVWIHDPKVLDWKENNKFWWALDNFKEFETDRMVKEALIRLTDSDSEEEAWDQLFKYHNKKSNLNRGYSPDEKIVIKVNMNGSGEWEDDYSGNSRMDYTNPVLLKSLLKSLVNNAKIPPTNITVIDPARIFPDYFVDYCSQNELKGIKFEGRNESEINLNSPIIWSKEFTNNISYFPKSVTEADYMINFASLKGHFWGVTLLAKNHFGTLMNENRFMPPVYAKLHQFVLNQNYNQYSALTDILLNQQLGEKTILYGFDALICTQTEGTNITNENSKWKMTPFNDDQTKSLFLSQDPLALDSVGIDFLTNEPMIINFNNAPIDRAVDNYLHEAALNQTGKASINYLNGDNEESKVKGVHEHWNNLNDKKYSRNLGKSEGIELEYCLI